MTDVKWSNNTDFVPQTSFGSSDNIMGLTGSLVNSKYPISLFQPANTEVTVSSTGKTLALSDAWTTQLFTNSLGGTLIIDLNSNVPLPIGTKISVIQMALNPVFAAPVTGVSTNSLVGPIVSTSGQYAKMDIEKIGTDSFVISGDIVSASNLPLDDIPVENIAGAWSIRKLRTLYTGFVARVRRSSDNAITDVSFDTSNTLSLSSPVTAGGNLGTWASTNNVYVVTRYDQGANANDITIATQSAQPRIINAGTIETANFASTVNYYSGNQTLNASDSISLDIDDKQTMFSVVQFNSFSALGTILDKRGTSGNQPGYLYYAAPNNFSMQWNTTLSTAQVATSPTLTAGTLYSLSAKATKGVSAELFMRGVSAGSGSLSTIGSSINSSPLLVGSNNAGLSSTQNLDGYLSELILLNVVATDEQFNRIIDNQINYYLL